MKDFFIFFCFIDFVILSVSKFLELTAHVFIWRSSPSEVIFGKDVLKLCSKFTGGHPCWSAISIKLQSKFIEIALRHECSPVNLLIIFIISSYKNTSRRLLLYLEINKNYLFFSQKIITDQTEFATGIVWWATNWKGQHCYCIYKQMCWRYTCPIKISFATS